MTADLLSAIELELMRLKVKPGKYYRLRTGHLIRLLDLCEFIPEMKRLVDGKFFCCYITRLCEILGREIRLVHKLALGNVTCILDLENLRRIAELLQEEAPATTPIQPVIPVKVTHSNGFRVHLRRWCDNHKDIVNSFPGAVLAVLILIIMIVTELK